MNTSRFQDMIKQYSDELLKMNKEKALAEPQEKAVVPTIMPEEIKDTAEKNEEDLSAYDTMENETENAPAPRASVEDIPGIENTDFYKERESDEAVSEPDTETDFAYFSARVFTGNNAYAVENAKVLIVKNDRLYTFLTTDKDGKTKRIKLPSYPEENSFDSKSEEQRVDYTGEVYAKGFTPKKNLLISAVGGSDIILDVQLTPLSEGVK